MTVNEEINEVPVTEEPKVESEPLMALSDQEFLDRINALSAPFYDEYVKKYQVGLDIHAECFEQTTCCSSTEPAGNPVEEEPCETPKDEILETQTPVIDDVLEAQTPVIESDNKPDKKKRKKAVKRYISERPGAHAIILILSLVVIGVAVLGCITGMINIAPVDEYITLFNTAGSDRNIDVIDPVLALVNNFVNLGLSNGYSQFFQLADIQDVIAVYAVAGSVLLILILAICYFIMSIVALASKKDNNGYVKKLGFGAVSIIMFICSLIVLVGGFMLSGLTLDMDGILAFLLPDGTKFCAGYGLFGLIAISILTFICSCCGYKREK